MGRNTPSWRLAVRALAAAAVFHHAAVTFAQAGKPAAVPDAGSLYDPQTSGMAARPDDPQGLAAGFIRRVVLNGQLRIRYEIADPASYRATAADPGSKAGDDFVLQRTRLAARFDVHDRISLYAQIQDSRIWGEEQNVVFKSEDTLDLHQGYMTLRNLLGGAAGGQDLTLIAGRQELAYGDQRLISPLDWSNVARAWDAARLVFTGEGALEGLQVDLFASIIQDTDAGASGTPARTPDGADEKQEFHGLYASYRFQPFASLAPPRQDGKQAGRLFAPHTADAYVLYRGRHDRSFASEDGSTVTGTADDATLGARLKGGLAWFDYGFELVYQLGRIAGDPLEAYGLVLEGGFNFPETFLPEKTRLRLGAEFDYGSGDEDPADGRRQTFDPLYPNAHTYQGIADQFTWKNGQDLAFKATATLPPFPSIDLGPIWIEAQYHIFWLSEKRDGWFDAALNQIRRDASGNAPRYVGMELDLHAKYNVVEFGSAPGSPPGKLWLWIGYAHFFPGDFVRRTGEEPDRDFFHAALLLDV